MAAPLSADRLLSALKAEGCRVVVRSGWETHNRNRVGPWGGVNGVVIHHTAGINSLGLCWSGTSSLPGPLCHSHLSKLGLVTMVGHGRANHAGTFARNAHDAVVNESSTHPRPDAAEPVDGNRHYYGIEIENLGNGRDPYPGAQYDAAVRWAAAICRAHGWSANSVIGHKEGTRRKIDPSFDMGKFRAAVAARLKTSPGGTTVPPITTTPEDPMAGFTKQDIYDAVWSLDRMKPPAGAETPTNPTWQAQSLLRDAAQRARAVEAKVDALSAPELTDGQVMQIANALAAHPTLAEQIAESVADKIAARLAE